MKFSCVLAIGTLLAACSSAPQVTSEPASAAPFSGYRSYTWHAKPLPDNPLGQQRIIDDVDAELRSRKWVESSDGDVIIVASIITGQKRTTDTYHSQGIGRGWGLRGGIARGGGGYVPMKTPAVTSVHTSTICTLALRMLDARTHKPVWRGAIKITVSNSQKKNDEALDAGIVKLFSGFPPNGRP